MSSNEQLRNCSNGSNIRPDSHDLPFSVRDEDNVSMAKGQLHAMVRSHLKAFSNSIDLDNGTLKVIATSSMHTILAACRLEHIGVARLKPCLHRQIVCTLKEWQLDKRA
ncbi:hypothetical protein F3Y22_tig00116958pilonHSYRG00280 [Hibiscus syriacus]|uniref:Uncharacterized protein n=2 Tax=Hibiscus syriacus TaxID=106335 RepID=A0A6A2WKF1_HIBSY|nr:hypothetical protein F3Y22_tig00116958pilonHSYRG00280 [Hibiscus syriacus]